VPRRLRSVRRGTPARPTGDREGQGLAEYALILSLIALVAILALIALGSNLGGLLSDIGQSV
jgi:Flp pilus assembly pilin Flp